MIDDLRLAIRQLRQTPGFTTVVALVLALGIGINVATFGAIDALFFRPPAGVRAPHDVRRLDVVMPPTPGQQIFFNQGYSLSDVEALRARRGTFAQLGAYAGGTASLTDSGGRALAGDAEPRKLDVTLAGRGYFDALGVTPARGRFFTAQEDSAFDAAPVAVVTDAFWRQQLGADPAVLGHTIRLNGRPMTVIGVAPPGFRGLQIEPTDMFVPVSMAGVIGFQANYIRKPSMKWLHAVARLAPGVDERQASAVGTTVLRAADTESGERVVGFDAKRQRGMRAAPLNEHFSQDAFERSSPLPLWILGATGAVLLVVCANVANLLVARAERRRREIATRLALGAQTRRIVRQLFAEGLVLALLGGTLGLAVAAVGTRLILLVPDMPALEHLLDARAALFALGITLVTTLGFALVPAVQAARGDAGELLRAGVRGTARATPVRTVLLAVQFAASLSLLGVGGLFVRSLQNVRAVDVGFPVGRELVAAADWTAFGVTSKEAHAILERAAGRIVAMPNVTGTARVSIAPFSGASMSSLRVPGRDDLSAISGVPGGMFFTNSVDTSYFRTMGIPIVRGRGFDARDRADSPATIVISETFARRVWPGEDAVGKCVYTDTDAKAPCVTVIGVARDARFLSLTQDPSPIFYGAYARQTDGPTQLIVQLRDGTSEAARQQAIRAIRAAVMAEEPRLTFATVRPLGEQPLKSALSPYRVSAAAFSVFGGLALVLAAIGLYGVVAYAVAQRTGEFGVRAALGARGRDLTALVLRQGLRLCAAGGVLGTLGAVAVGRLLQERLYGVKPLDVPTLGAVAALLAATALIACWLPARRAARVDPAVALRSE